MAVGQVSFHDPKMVKKIHIPQRLNPIVNRLNKTKVEKFPNLRQEKDDRQKELRQRDRAAQQTRVSAIAASLMNRCMAIADNVGPLAKGRGSSRQGEEGTGVAARSCV
jgi:hypothetical protein